MKETVYQRPLLKLLSLIIAITLWLYVQGDRREEKTLNVSIELVNLPAQLMLTHEVNPVLTVLVRGPRARLARLRSGQVAPYTLDLNAAKKGANTFWIKEADVKLPSGILIKSISPQVVRLELDDRVSKTLKVLPKWVGQLPYGYKLGGVSAQPSVVTVVGPAKELEPVLSISTDAINLSDAFDHTTRVVSLEPLGPWVHYDVKATQVSWTLEDGEGERVFSGLSLKVDAPQEKLTLLPESLELTCKGFASALSKLEPKDVQITLNAWDLELTRSWQELTLEPCKFIPPRPGVECRCSPSKIKVIREPLKVAP